MKQRLGGYGRWRGITPEERTAMMQALAQRSRQRPTWQPRTPFYTRFLCAEDCECCPDEDARTSLARERQSTYMRNLQVLSRQAITRKGFAILGQQEKT